MVYMDGRCMVVTDLGIIGAREMSYDAVLAG
jgi:hypothetical protein